MAKTPRWAVAAPVTVAAAIVALGIWALQPGGYVRPIGFSQDQGVAHLPADRPGRLKTLIRLPEVADIGHQYWEQNFDIAIDPAGHPITVKYLSSPDRPAPPATADAAIAQIRTWQFVPLQAKGHPVYAWFVGEFTLVPEQDRPTVHIPFPPVTDLTKVIMTYDEAGPRRLPRAVTVRGDGHVEIANTSVLSQQHFQVTIPQEQVLSLIDGFRRADFFSLQDGYGGGPSEGVARKISITIDGQTKTIGDYEGQYDGLPDAVMEVEGALLRAGGFEP
jgi:hypothetical protein